MQLCHQPGVPLPLNPLLASLLSLLPPFLTCDSVSCPFSVTCPKQARALSWGRQWAELGQGLTWAPAQPTTHRGLELPAHCQPGTGVSRGETASGGFTGSDTRNAAETETPPKDRRSTHTQRACVQAHTHPHLPAPATHRADRPPAYGHTLCSRSLPTLWEAPLDSQVALWNAGSLSGAAGGQGRRGKSDEDGGGGSKAKEHRALGKLKGEERGSPLAILPREAASQHLTAAGENDFGLRAPEHERAKEG